MSRLRAGAIGEHALTPAPDKLEWAPFPIICARASGKLWKISRSCMREAFCEASRHTLSGRLFNIMLENRRRGGAVKVCSEENTSLLHLQSHRLGPRLRVIETLEFHFGLT